MKEWKNVISDNVVESPRDVGLRMQSRNERGLIIVLTGLNPMKMME